MKIKKRSFYFVELLPFKNLDIKLDISKFVTARSFKLAPLVEDNE